MTEFAYTLADGRRVTIRGTYYPETPNRIDEPGSPAGFQFEDYVDAVGFIHLTSNLSDGEVDKIEHVGVAHARTQRIEEE